MLRQNAELAAGVKEVMFSLDGVKPQEIYIRLLKHCEHSKPEAAIRQSIKTMQADGTSRKIFADKIILQF